MSKQIINVELFEIEVWSSNCVNKLLMSNWFLRDTYQYLEQFNCVQTNELCWIELFVLIYNTWNSLTVCLNWIIGIT